VLSGGAMLVAMFERFTERARRVLVLAQEEARLLNHDNIGTEHILLGLIHEGEGVAAQALESLGISLEAAREKVEETRGPASSSTTGSPPFTPRAKQVLELSLREALQLRHNYIGTEHLLLGVVREGEGVAVQVLVALGVDLSRVRERVIELLSGVEGEVSPGPGSREVRWLRADQPRRGPPVDSSLSEVSWPATTGMAAAVPLEGLIPGLFVAGGVDLTYSHGDLDGSKPGRLSGALAGQPVDLAVGPPLSEGQAQGTFGSLEVSAAWKIGGDSDSWGPAWPAYLGGTFGEVSANLYAWIRFDDEPTAHGNNPDHYVKIEGDFAGRPVSVYIALTDPDSVGGSFAAHGIFAGSDFSVRGKVTCGFHATLVGAISGQPVRVNAGLPDGPDGLATVNGSYDGPAALLLIMAGSLLFFL
jgi:Clp amino terminal domain, pathogenicity island component